MSQVHKQVLISRLAWELLEWEVHALRNLVTATMAEVVLYRRMVEKTHQPNASDARELYIRIAQMRRDYIERGQKALTDDEYRRIATREMAGHPVPEEVDDEQT